MTAGVALDAVDLTALVERVASRAWERHCADTFAANHTVLSCWAEQPPMTRHVVREGATPLVDDVLRALRRQAVGVDRVDRLIAAHLDIEHQATDTTEEDAS